MLSRTVFLALAAVAVLLAGCASAQHDDDEVAYVQVFADATCMAPVAYSASVLNHCTASDPTETSSMVTYTYVQEVSNSTGDFIISYQCPTDACVIANCDEENAIMNAETCEPFLTGLYTMVTIGEGEMDLEEFGLTLPVSATVTYAGDDGCEGEPVSALTLPPCVAVAPTVSTAVTCNETHKTTTTYASADCSGTPSDVSYTEYEPCESGNGVGVQELCYEGHDHNDDDAAVSMIASMVVVVLAVVVAMLA